MGAIFLNEKGFIVPYGIRLSHHAHVTGKLPIRIYGAWYTDKVGTSGSL